MDTILEQVFCSAEASSLKGRHFLESQRAAAQLHFLPGGKTKDIAAVALEAGNSGRMIFAHYRELCTETEAAEWFGILPVSEATNVVRMTA